MKLRAAVGFFTTFSAKLPSVKILHVIDYTVIFSEKQGFYSMYSIRYELCVFRHIEKSSP